MSTETVVAEWNDGRLFEATISELYGVIAVVNRPEQVVFGPVRKPPALELLARPA